MTTFTPCVQSLFAMAKPMPELAPVTTAHSALYFFLRSTGRRSRMFWSCRGQRKKEKARAIERERLRVCVREKRVFVKRREKEREKREWERKWESGRVSVLSRTRRCQLKLMPLTTDSLMASLYYLIE